MFGNFRKTRESCDNRRSWCRFSGMMAECSPAMLLIQSQPDGSKLVYREAMLTASDVNGSS